MDGGAGDDVYHVDADDQVVDSDASLDDDRVIDDIAGGSLGRGSGGTIASIAGWTVWRRGLTVSNIAWTSTAFVAGEPASRWGGPISAPTRKST